MVPGASAGAMPNCSLEPSATAVSELPLSAPPRTETVIGTSLESALSVFQTESGIVHDVAAVRTTRSEVWLAAWMRSSKRFSPEGAAHRKKGRSQLRGSSALGE